MGQCWSAILVGLGGIPTEFTDANVILKCEVQVVSDQRPHKSVKRQAYVTADQLALFDPRSLRAPVEVIQLTQVASLSRRAEGNEGLRLDSATGRWWELRAEGSGSLDRLSIALEKRVNTFQMCRRRASVLSMPPAKQLTKRMTLRNAKKQMGAPEDHRTTCCHGMMLSIGRRDLAARISTRRTAFQGASIVHSSLVDVARLESISSPDLDQSEGLLWTQEVIDYLLSVQEIPNDLACDFTMTVRRGVPDGLKRVIWPLAVGAGGDFASGRCEAAYKSVLSRAFGDAVPDGFEGTIPTFSNAIEGAAEAPDLNAVAPNAILLSEKGYAALCRLLWCTTLVHSRVEYCPFLPNLITVLLVFFEEAEVMRIVDSMLVHAASETGVLHPTMILTPDMLNRQTKLFLREAKRPHGVPDLLVHLEKAGLDLPTLALHMLPDGLARLLPLRALCRVYGAVLAEGSLVILHYALALLKHAASSILECQTMEDVLAALKRVGDSITDEPTVLDSLTKTAFAFKLETATRRRMSSTLVSTQIDRKKGVGHVFCRPRLYEPRGACPDVLWQAIWPWVPHLHRSLDPKLIYTLSSHGRMLKTMLHKCIDKNNVDNPMIFFVYSAAGDIIGGFSPIPWSQTGGSYIDCCSLRGSAADAFVFRKLSSGGVPEVFPWTGRNERLFFASDQLGLGFGGDGVAIGVDKDLTWVHTSPSETFECPSLCPPDAGCADGVSFEITRFEVFVLR